VVASGALITTSAGVGAKEESTDGRGVADDVREWALERGNVKENPGRGV
jgi:hypothetical protein